jgi:molecular chaperone DnaJ
MSEDYYKVLGVAKTATQDEIKKAYRDLAIKHHPDRNKDKGAEAKMQQLNEAYAVLGDPEKRRQYDTFGSEGFNQRFSQEDIFRNFNVEDLFKEFGFGGGGFGFPGFGSGFGGMEEQEQTGVNLYLSFDDLERGVEKEFDVQHVKRCEHCDGTGGEPGSKQVKCTSCDGHGRKRVQQNTIFGRFEMVTACNKCRGRGKTYDKLCRECRGEGKVLVRERFTIKAGKPGGGGKKEDTRRKFGVF